MISLSNKWVIWGHKLHSHSHSYVHLAFYRALQHLGAQVRWLDHVDDISSLDFTDSVFLTTGVGDQSIPLDSSCFYVLLNCDDSKYSALRSQHRVLNIEPYTDVVLERSAEQLAPLTYFNGTTLDMPWATDLLPGEIQENKPGCHYNPASNVITWVGTIAWGAYSNFDQLESFRRACAENHIVFFYRGLYANGEGVPPEIHMRLIRESYMAPTLVGPWQRDHGYIPCRIFKNISYGQFGVTNSPRVHELFSHRLIYNPDPYQLFYDAHDRLPSIPLAEQWSLMDFVKEQHTYLNRIQTIIECAGRI